MPDPLDALMRICDGDLDDVARATICECVTAYRDGHCASLDQAFRLQARRPGQRKASTVLRQLERDQALVKAANQFSGRTSSKAREVARMLCRYAGTKWKRTGKMADCPHPPDSQEAALWRALRANGGRPIGFEAIRKLLVRS